MHLFRGICFGGSASFSPSPALLSGKGHSGAWLCTGKAGGSQRLLPLGRSSPCPISTHRQALNPELATETLRPSDAQDLKSWVTYQLRCFVAESRRWTTYRTSSSKDEISVARDLEEVIGGGRGAQGWAQWHHRRLRHFAASLQLSSECWFSSPTLSSHGPKLATSHIHTGTFIESQGESQEPRTPSFSVSFTKQALPTAPSKDFCYVLFLCTMLRKMGKMDTRCSQSLSWEVDESARKEGGEEWEKYICVYV